MIYPFVPLTGGGVDIEMIALRLPALWPADDYLLSRETLLDANRLFAQATHPANQTLASMFSITAEANSLVLSLVAPGIRRSKS
jgi:hypothetical protein